MRPSFVSEVEGGHFSRGRADGLRTHGSAMEVSPAYGRMNPCMYVCLTNTGGIVVSIACARMDRGTDARRTPRSASPSRARGWTVEPLRTVMRVARLSRACGWPSRESTTSKGCRVPHTRGRADRPLNDAVRETAVVSPAHARRDRTSCGLPRNEHASRLRTRGVPVRNRNIYMPACARMDRPASRASGACRRLHRVRANEPHCRLDADFKVVSHTRMRG